MMTNLAITPNIDKKTAKIAGSCAAGEHVSVTISGMDGVSTGNLYLRVMFGPATIAQFPPPVHDDETPEEWTSEEGAISCILNLNTIQALKHCRGFDNECLFVLEDLGDDPQMYFASPKSVQFWPQKRLHEFPFNLDAYPGLIREWKDRMSEWEGYMDNFGVTAEKVGGTTTLTVVDKDGSPTVCYINDGDAAVSPTASVSKADGVATITITDANGTTTATIIDGEEQDVSGKMDKVPGAEADRFAIFTNDGAVTDSDYSASSFALASHTHSDKADLVLGKVPHEQIPNLFYTDVDGLADVAHTGRYDQLVNRPDLSRYAEANHSHGSEYMDKAELMEALEGVHSASATVNSLKTQFNALLAALKGLDE